MTAPAPRLLERVHVLVVDEDAAARERIEQIVTEEGGIVTPVGTAQKALDVSAVIRPTVVVSDLRLGGGRSGVWLLDQMRSGPLATVPVIATSRVDADAALASALPFSGFIVKPVDPRELCALILGVVDRRSAGARPHTCPR